MLHVCGFVLFVLDDTASQHTEVGPGGCCGWIPALLRVAKNCCRKTALGQTGKDWHYETDVDREMSVMQVVGAVVPDGFYFSQT